VAERTHPSQTRYPPELKARAVRMALETMEETGVRQGTDRLVAHDDPTFSEEFLHVAIAKREAEGQPHGVADDLAGEPVPRVE